MPRSIVASAPGSAMLFGEHAVLRGGPAIVAAIDYRLSVTIHPRPDTQVDVQSAFGSVTTTLDSLSLGPRLRFVEAVLQRFRSRLPCGLSVAITSHIDPTVGLASSAAVTVALAFSLHAWIDGGCDRQALLLECCDIIRSVQGFGSGADAAAIVYGGVIAYQMDQAVVTPLCSQLPLVLVYSGQKTPTPEVIRYVQEKERSSPDIYKAIFSAIDRVTIAAVDAARHGNLVRLGDLMNQAHGLMEALSVGTNQLSALCWALRERPSIYGAKISGSGLGDCVVGVGSAPDLRTIASSVTAKGVEVEIWN